MPPQQPTTTVAILGGDTLVEDILAQLLQKVGHDVRAIEAYSIRVVGELIDGVDILLLAPGLDEGVRQAFRGAVRSAPETATLPILQVSPDLKGALLDEQAVLVSWQALFEALVGEIEATLGPEGTAGEPPAEAAAG